jgi:hypothetical protein
MVVFSDEGGSGSQGAKNGQYVSEKYKRWQEAARAKRKLNRYISWPRPPKADDQGRK